MGPDEVEKAVHVNCVHTVWGGGAGSQDPAPTLLFQNEAPIRSTLMTASGGGESTEVPPVHPDPVENQGPEIPLCTLGTLEKRMTNRELSVVGSKIGDGPSRG